jgi:hypothetical protein
MTRVSPGEGTGVRKYELICNQELSETDEAIRMNEGSQGEVLKIQTIIHDGRVLLQPSLVRTPSWEVRKDRCRGLLPKGKFGDVSRCSNDEKYEEEVNVDDIERMEAEILSEDEKEEEENYGNVPTKGDDNDNYDDEDSDNYDEDAHPGIKVEELRELDVQDTDDEINEVLETTHMLSAEQREGVKLILRRYRKSFSSTPGLCVKFEYEFELTDHAPFSYRERPIPYAIRDAVREQIEMMIRQGIIEPATLPYSNPLVIVPKANKVPRICLDA